jgi:hypothetical protein
MRDEIQARSPLGTHDNCVYNVAVFTEHRNVASIGGVKRVRFDGHTRLNIRQPPAKRRIFCKRGGSKVRHLATVLDLFNKPEEWKALSYDRKSEIMI